MLVNIGAMKPVELTQEQIDELAFVAWHVAYPGGYDGKPSDIELKELARFALQSVASK